MIQALFNILHWPIFWRRKAEEEVAPLDKIEVAPKVGWGLFAKDKRKSCPILDTSDRLAALLGEPAKQTYMEMVKLHEAWSHSEVDTMVDIYHAGYVGPAQAMWGALMEQWTGTGKIPLPLPDSLVTPELIWPEITQLTVAERDAILTYAPYIIFVNDWKEALSRMAEYKLGPGEAVPAYAAWRKLEAVRGRSQPDLSGALPFTWEWFYGHLRLQFFSSWLTQENSVAVHKFSYNYIGDAAWCTALWITFWYRAGFGLRWDGPRGLIIEIRRALQSMGGPWIT